MNRWQLQDGCVFVDAYEWAKDLKSPERIPKKLPHAHLIDKVTDDKGADRDVITFNNLAGFIMRFIVLGVDTDVLLPQIVASEYDNISPEEAKKEVDSVVAGMKKLGYLVPRKVKRTRSAELPTIHKKQKHSESYSLDFSIHSYGGGVVKGPY